MKKMGRKFLWLWLIIGLIGVLGGCAGGNNTEMQKQELSLQTLEGVVEEATMTTITVRTDTGALFCFDQSEVQVTAENGMIIGDIVTVIYNGELDEAESIQSVEVREMIIQPSEKRLMALHKEQELTQMLADMTLAEKVGQMFIARCPISEAAQKAADYHLGGYILFARDFQDRTQEQVIEEIAAYQETASIPMLMAVDEEGGTVNRLSRYPQFRDEPFASPQQLYQQGGWEAIEGDAREKAALLKYLGINVNLAPVCDVSQNPDDYIYARTFGQDAQATAQYVATVVTVMVDEQLGAVLKHFPGYGDNVDTHTGIAYDQRSYDQFEQSDFLPFVAGIEAGASCVLVSHNIVTAMDSNLPASLSPEVHRILREELNFNGVIMTDDLEMKAIKQYLGDKEAAVAAVVAGNDLICCTDFEVQVSAVLQAVQDGSITEEQINQSVRRILAWKQALNLI